MARRVQPSRSLWELALTVDASPSVVAEVLVLHEAGHDDAAAPASRRASCEPGPGSSDMSLKVPMPRSRARGSAVSAAAGGGCSGSYRALEAASGGRCRRQIEVNRSWKTLITLCVGRVGRLTGERLGWWRVYLQARCADCEFPHPRTKIRASRECTHREQRDRNTRHESGSAMVSSSSVEQIARSR